VGSSGPDAGLAVVVVELVASPAPDGPPPSDSPAGSRCKQDCWAATKRDWLTLSCCGVTFGIPPLLAVGSGKLGTPCERIQAEYARSPVVVVFEPVTTLGVDGTPQAATTTPTARIPAVINAARTRPIPMEVLHPFGSVPRTPTSLRIEEAVVVSPPDGFRGSRPV
jgi:hypothetical protein